MSENSSVPMALLGIGKVHRCTITATDVDLTSDGRVRLLIRVQLPPARRSRVQWISAKRRRRLRIYIAQQPEPRGVHAARAVVMYAEGADADAIWGATGYTPDQTQKILLLLRRSGLDRALAFRGRRAFPVGQVASQSLSQPTPVPADRCGP